MRFEPKGFGVSAHNLRSSGMAYVVSDTGGAQAVGFQELLDHGTQRATDNGRYVPGKLYAKAVLRHVPTHYVVRLGP